MKLKRSGNDSDQIRGLQDEIDVLRPQAERAEKLESQLEKLRDKIDELKDVKTQLSKEQMDHQQTFSRLVNVEKEVESLQKAKVQLEEYRGEYAFPLLSSPFLSCHSREPFLWCLTNIMNELGEYAEANIKIEELMIRVKQKDEALQNLMATNGQLSGCQKNQVTSK